MWQKTIVPSLALLTSARRVNVDQESLDVRDWHEVCNAFVVGHIAGRHGLGSAGANWLGQDGCKSACDDHSGCNFVTYDTKHGVCWLETVPEFPNHFCDSNTDGWSYWRGELSEPEVLQESEPEVPVPVPSSDSCGDLNHPSNAVCKPEVEWAYTLGRHRHWAPDAYRGVEEYSGLGYMDATIEDFQQFFYCGGARASQSCGVPPCSCTNPPCDRCFRGDAGSCYAPHDVAANPYVLDWSAEGPSFFDDFEFKTVTQTMGSSQYLARDQAFHEGVIEANENNAILRVGNRTGNMRRHSAHIRTWKRWSHFLVALKYNKAPWGPGVWPAFWMNGHSPWPQGGELDIWEWANDEAMKVSMHTGNTNMCDLHPDEVNKCKSMPDKNQMNYNCYTWYRPEDPLLGCGPTAQSAYRPGEYWANNPGVLAMEWAEGFVKVFYIPESEIPGDLAMNSPQPNTWDQYVISFFPFASSERHVPGSCPRDPLSPQQLILNIELCGDWAGYTWRPDRRAPHHDKYTEKLRTEECKVSHSTGNTDCCTNHMAEPEMDDFIAQNAVFDISYLKVFKQQEQQ